MEHASKLIQLNHEESRNDAVRLAIRMLQEQEVSVVELYETILAKALQEIDCREGDKECIWKEHIETSIVRTIVENSYPYLIDAIERVPKKQKLVVVLCPEEEYHEIGARMAHDFFLLHGYDAVFIGANTPKDVAMDAVEILKPDYLAISVTNMYNVVHAKRIVQAAKALQPDLRILAGGVAFYNRNALESVGADYHLTSFQSIAGVED
jgi:methanogenic corrinoid protein MtbC1